MSLRVNPVKRLWYRWKMLRLPWRKKWLVGFDLTGNTFWEFKDALNAGRLRRIVHYSRNVHYADVKITPSWIQWLRHTRHEPPTINEQQLDEIRQANMKQLAAIADARWAAKSSALDAPSKQQPLPGAQSRDPGGHLGQIEAESREGVRSVVEKQEKVKHSAPGEPIDQGKFEGERKEPRWKGFKMAMGKSDLQREPEAWTPSAALRR